MKTIFKYKLRFPSVIEDIEFPKGAELLDAQVVDEEIFVWAKVDPEAELETRTIRTLGTGHQVPEDENLKHIGTTQMLGGKLIWHVFEVIK